MNIHNELLSIHDEYYSLPIVKNIFWPIRRRRKRNEIISAVLGMTSEDFNKLNNNFDVHTKFYELPNSTKVDEYYMFPSWFSYFLGLELNLDTISSLNKKIKKYPLLKNFYGLVSYDVSFQMMKLSKVYEKPNIIPIMNNTKNNGLVCGYGVVPANKFVKWLKNND